MNFYGDIPQNHLELLQELKNLEVWFNEHGEYVSPVAASKGFVCMAHDYYGMDMEEEGERLLYRAETCYPGYFNGPIQDQRSQDRDFDYLVANLSKTMALELMQSLGFGE